VKRPTLYKTLSDAKYNIVFDICGSLIRTFGPETIEMTDNPSEFVNLALDVADRQKLPVLKAGAAKLLENVCDKQDGLLLETGLIFLELIDFISKGK